VKLLDIFVQMEPQGKPRPPFAFRGRTYTPGETREAEARIKTACEATLAREGKEPHKGPVDLSIIAVLHRPVTCRREEPTVRPDWDDLGRIISDALNGVLYEDDAQVVRAAVQKIYAHEPGQAPGFRIVAEGV
jgi:Holliday junction resolvase RusA-like endonuclease